MAVSAAIALAPIIPALRPDIQGIIVLEFGAVGLIRVATLTGRGETRPGGAARGHAAGPVIDTTATVVDDRAPDRATGAGPCRAGPTSARAHPAGPPPGPPPPPASSGAAARWAGRTSGAAVASGKQVAADYRPEAEAQVKRTIRGIGKLAGRVSARPSTARRHRRLILRRATGWEVRRRRRS